MQATMHSALLTQKRRRILLSAFATSPVWGSEPGVGWHWTIELCKRHDVVLLTHSYFRQQIEEHLETLPAEERPQGLLVAYFSPGSFGLHSHTLLNSRLYYSLWQLRVRSLARRLCRTHKIELIHHLTWGTFRFPCFLGGLGVPLVLGPLGGGDVAPMRLYEGLPWLERWREALRALSLSMSRFDPLIRPGLAHAELIFCKTHDTLRALPTAYQAKARLGCEIGAPESGRRCQTAARAQAPAAQTPPDARRPFKLLYAGRLVGLKGVLLLIGTLNLLVRAGHAVELELAGDGPLRDLLLQRSHALGLTGRVRMLGKLDRPTLMGVYEQADLFFFPSLHDSSGNVVLEALSRGLPVICLDLGGPKHYVTPRCGIVVETGDKSRQEVEQLLASEIGQLINDSSRLAEMSRCALEHAAASSWQACVDVVYAAIEDQLAWNRPRRPELSAQVLPASFGSEVT